MGITSLFPSVGGFHSTILATSRALRHRNCFVFWLHTRAVAENGGAATVRVFDSQNGKKGSKRVIGRTKIAVSSLRRSSARVNAGSSWTKSEGKIMEVGDSSLDEGKNFGKKRTQSTWGNLTETSLEAEEENDDKRKVGSFQRRQWVSRDQNFQGTRHASDKSVKFEFQRRDDRSFRNSKDASPSSIPKMAGEAVYGLGPVLAALSIGRRQFYSLYVQDGLDLNSNNKKKDKMGFQRVLKMAETIGVSIKAISKHDLNMIVDSRPHQGLVLDASPLEMVRITELDPVHSKEDRNSLWVALDEVTDPQNLGAIIRSSYFFGVTGIVLCAKNSAPLSGVVSKSSAGSLELMELRYCRNMMQFLVASAENGWRVLGGSVGSKAAPLNEIAPGEPTILVLGNEGTGLRKLVERSCSQLVRIPSNVVPAEEDDSKDEETTYSREAGSFLAVESLNVSVAAGVLLHHLSGSS